MQDTLLERTVEEFLNALALGQDDGIVVAVSGGADSMALLCALQAVQPKFGFPMLAAHVHHGLRGEEADRDAAFVRLQCEQRHIPFEMLQVDVAAEALPGEGTEQAGRRIRYTYFEQLRATYGYRYIATAHTADDNLETVLMHLTRGSGLHGLCGILPIHDAVMRPLLACSREDIEQYCSKQGVSFVTDSTNTQLLYSRNRIRHAVVPQLKQLNPQVVDACIRMTARLREEDAFLDRLAQELLQTAKNADGTFGLSALQEAEPLIRRRALKALAEQAGGDPAEKHILLAEQMIYNGNGVVQMPDGVNIAVRGDHVHIERETAAIEIPYFEQPVTVGKCVEIAGQRYVPQCLSIYSFEQKRKVYKNVLKFACDYDKISHDILVRQRKSGDTFHPVGGCGKTLKKYFNEKKLSLLQRSVTPIVADEKGIVIVAGYSCDDRVKLDENTKRVFLLCPMEYCEEEKSCEYT